MQIVFEGKTLNEITGQVLQFLESTKQPVDLDNRHPHGNVPVEDTSAEQTQPEDTSDQAEASDISVEQLQEALRGHVKRKGRDSAVAILAKYDVIRASQITDEAKRIEAHEELTNG